MCQNPMKPKPYKIRTINKETELDWTFRVDSDTKPEIGQFYMISLPKVGEMPISISGLGDDWIDFTIRNVGKVSSVVHTLCPGANLFIRGPYGTTFPMEEFKGSHLLVVAGGSATSPVRPIINYFTEHPAEVSKMDVVIGFRDPSQIMFKDDVQKWQNNGAVITVDVCDSSWTGCTGFCTDHLQDIDISDPEKLVAVIVGPPLMIKFTALELLNLGIKEDQIIVSLERNMSCGLGKCGHCKIGDAYVCLDGPVFRYPDALKLID